MKVLGFRARSRGFTLVEFMVTMAVLVITLGLAVPAFSSFIARNQGTAIKSSFMSSTALARAEAARAGMQVVLQAAAGGSAGNEFAGGWDLYLDVDGSGTVTAGDTLLRHYEALPSGVTLHGGGTVLFSANGYLVPVANLSYTLCRADGTGYSMVLAPNGTAYSSAITGCTP